MYRFLLTRRWLVASLVVLTAVIVMVMLGLWQLRRLGEVTSSNDRVRSRLALPVAAVDEVHAPGVDQDDAVYRRVEATGRFDETEEVVLDNRSNQGRAGKHLLTPLVTESGRALIVDRGWVPLDISPEAATAARPPSGTVRVVGVLFSSERKGAFGPTIPRQGRLTAVPRVDVARLAQQLPYPAFPLYLRIVSQSPQQPGELPIPPGVPDLDDGPHLSYAVQWFLFATVALAVFVALARREARRKATRVPSA
ncbi:MAG: SURF1 family protein [Actinomycetota bacterium]